MITSKKEWTNVLNKNPDFTDMFNAVGMDDIDQRLYFSELRKEQKVTLDEYREHIASIGMAGLVVAIGTAGIGSGWNIVSNTALVLSLMSYGYCLAKKNDQRERSLSPKKLRAVNALQRAALEWRSEQNVVRLVGDTDKIMPKLPALRS